MESLLVPRIGAGDIRACPLCEEDDTIPEPEKVTPLVAILMRNATNIIAIFKIIWMEKCTHFERTSIGGTVEEKANGWCVPTAVVYLSPSTLLSPFSYWLTCRPGGIVRHVQLDTKQTDQTVDKSLSRSALIIVGTEPTIPFNFKYLNHFKEYRNALWPIYRYWY